MTGEVKIGQKVMIVVPSVRHGEVGVCVEQIATIDNTAFLFRVSFLDDSRGFSDGCYWSDEFISFPDNCTLEQMDAIRGILS